jgi:hypothetical protein
MLPIAHAVAVIVLPSALLAQASWTRLYPSSAPSRRFDAGVAFDSVRGQVVLFGGRVLQGPHVNDLWAWTGTQWTTVSTPVAPPARVGFGLASDTNRGRIYATSAPATVGAYGSGCAGVSGVPVLANEAHSLPWLGDTFRTRASTLAASTGAVVFATGLAATPPVDLSPFGMPGCNSWLAIDAVEFAPAAAGASTWSLTIPNSAAFAGVHLNQQVFALEAGANAAGVITTNAIECVVGIR